MLSYSDLKARFDGRRKGRNERKLLGHSFYVYDGGDGALHLQHVYAIKYRHRPEYSLPGPIAKVWPHGEIYFTPHHSIKGKYQSFTERWLLYSLTGHQISFERNNSVMQLGWRYFSCIESKYLCPGKNNHYWVAPGEVVLRKIPGYGWIFGSREPVPMREWVPSKRAEYLADARTLMKNLELRAKVGAFNAIVKDPTPLWRRETPPLEQSVVTASVDDHESLKPLAVHALRERLYWAVHKIKDEVEIADSIKALMKRNRPREALRQKHGAVRYTTGE